MPPALLRSLAVTLLTLPAIVSAQAKVGDRFGAQGALDQGTRFAFTLETCYQRSGCIAIYLAGLEFLKALRGAKQLTIGFTIAEGRRPVALDAPLAGIADGLKAAGLEQ